MGDHKMLISKELRTKEGQTRFCAAMVACNPKDPILQDQLERAMKNQGITEYKHIGADKVITHRIKGKNKPNFLLNFVKISITLFLVLIII